MMKMTATEKKSKQNYVETRKEFQELWTTDKRFIILTGGRGSLKSTHAHYFIHDLTYEKGHGILFTRYLMTSADISIIPEFKVIIDRMGSSSDFIITKEKITNRITGSFILFKGIKTSSGDQTGNLKSISGITTWVMEEGEDFNDADKFDVIEKSVRTNDKQNRIIWIMNPTTRHHFIHKMFFEGNAYKKNYYGFDVTMSKHPDVLHIHTTYHCAIKYLNEGILKSYRRERTKALKEPETKYQSKYYQKYIGGWREQAEGVIYTNWRVGKFDEFVNYCYAMDYGVTDPTTLLKVGVDEDRKRIYLKQLIYKSDLSSEQLYELIEKRVELNGFIVADTNEKRTTRYLREKGINIKSAKKRQVIEDIRELLDYEIIVDEENSEETQLELNEYKWLDKKSDTPIGDYNHAMDGMRYGYNAIKRRQSIGV